jgi:hypothetical protein
MTYRIIATLASTQVEVGRDRYGFHCGLPRTQLGYDSIFGNCGSTDQSSSFYTYKDDLHQTITGRIVYVKDSLFTWSA